MKNRNNEEQGKKNKIVEIKIEREKVRDQGSGKREAELEEENRKLTEDKIELEK